MIACPCCRRHVRAAGEAPRCVFCGVLLDPKVVAVLLALTAPACGQEHYGIMVTDVSVEETGAEDTGDTGGE